MEQDEEGVDEGDEESEASSIASDQSCHEYAAQWSSDVSRAIGRLPELPSASWQIQRRKPASERKLKEDPYVYFCTHCSDASPEFISISGHGIVDHHRKYHTDCEKWIPKTCTRREAMSKEALGQGQDVDTNAEVSYQPLKTYSFS